MNRNIENIDRYLKSVVPPEHVSYQHERQLRQEVFKEIERRQTVSVRVKSWRYAAVIALIGAGVVAGAVVGVRYRFVAKDPQRGYLMESEDGLNTMGISERHATSPEQAVATAEEIARLKQQGQRELVGVIEIRANGQLDSRLFRWEYNLSDGRTITMGEPDRDAHATMTLTGERLAEATRLLQETVRNERGTALFVTTDEGIFPVLEEGGREKKTPTYEQVFQGRTFIFEKYTFTLSDGTEVIWSRGKPKENQ